MYRFLFTDKFLEGEYDLDIDGEADWACCVDQLEAMKKGWAETSTVPKK